MSVDSGISVSIHNNNNLSIYNHNAVWNWPGTGSLCVLVRTTPKIMASCLLSSYKQKYNIPGSLPPTPPTQKTQRACPRLVCNDQSTWSNLFYWNFQAFSKENKHGSFLFISFFHWHWRNLYVYAYLKSAVIKILLNEKQMVVKVEHIKLLVQNRMHYTDYRTLHGLWFCSTYYKAL